MRALSVQSPGESPVLSEVSAPAVAPGAVLVAVKAAGLNAVDAAIAAGHLAQLVPHEYPVGVGRDAAGVVLAVGEGVEGVSVGDEVVGHLPLFPVVSAGTVAEQVLLPAATVAAKPAALSWEQAAVVPLAGVTAASCVEAVGAQPGQTVLVTGATGGVGSYAVQLLAADGVTVIATGTGADADRLHELGAAHVLDWRAGDLVAQVRAIAPDGVDGLIELANQSADTAPLGAVRSGAVVAAPTGLMQQGDAVTAAGLVPVPIMAQATADRVAPLLARAAAGQLQIQPSTVLPLEQAAGGLAIFGPGASSRGKTVVRVAD